MRLSTLVTDVGSTTANRRDTVLVSGQTKSTSPGTKIIAKSNGIQIVLPVTLGSRDELSGVSQTYFFRNEIGKYFYIFCISLFFTLYMYAYAGFYFNINS